MVVLAHLDAVYEQASFTIFFRWTRLCLTLILRWALSLTVPHRCSRNLHLAAAAASAAYRDCYRYLSESSPPPLEETIDPPFPFSLVDKTIPPAIICIQHLSFRLAHHYPLFLNNTHLPTVSQPFLLRHALLHTIFSKVTSARSICISKLHHPRTLPPLFLPSHSAPKAWTSSSLAILHHITTPQPS